MGKYEESLERAKKIEKESPEWWRENQEAITEIFPELAESEDERIRKNLISFINLNKNSMFSQRERNEFINYLEKQKELSELGKYIANKRSEIGFYCNRKEVSWNEIPFEDRKHDYPYYFDGDIDCYPFIVEKQKEQKPAEWSKEDERHFNTIIRAIHSAGNITPIEGELAEKWLESRLCTWKPSKEQMETLRYAAGGNYVNLGILESLYNDLKKL